MVRFLRWVVLPVLAAAVVLFAFLALACGYVQFEMYIAASMKFGFCEKALPYVFLALLFVFATGIIPGWVFKRLRVRHALAYLTVGVLSGLLAEYCYMFESDIWNSWDFSVPSYEALLTSMFQQMPCLFEAMAGLTPFSLIPLGVGLIGCGLYWLIVARRSLRVAQ
jgi:hypothetical protein